MNRGGHCPHDDGRLDTTASIGVKEVMFKTKLGGIRSLGLILLADFAIVGAIKISFGVAGEILWLSHMGLLIAGIGLLSRSPFLTCTSLISIFAVHSLWLVDCLVWLVTGDFVLGVTDYLEDADLGTWVATAHHFYLIPLLVVVVLCGRQCPKGSLPGAAAVYLTLSLISRGFLEPGDNVNFAFRVATGLNWPLLRWVNELPGPLYLLTVNAFVSAVFFLPTYAALRSCCKVDGSALRVLARGHRRA